MRPFIPPFSREQNNPENVWVCCTKCGWQESFVLGSSEMTVIPAPGETEPENPPHVTKLPKKCPKCGARVEKYKVPPPIKY